jgi:hypothetical protein
MHLDSFQIYVGVMHKLLFCTCWDWPQIVIAWHSCILVFAVWVIREIDELGNQVGYSSFDLKCDPKWCQVFIFIIGQKGCYSSVDNEYCRIKAINFVYTCVVCLHTNIINFLLQYNYNHIQENVGKLWL